MGAEENVVARHLFLLLGSMFTLDLKHTNCTIYGTIPIFDMKTLRVLGNVLTVCALHALPCCSSEIPSL